MAFFLQALSLGVFSALRPVRRLAFSLSDGHLLQEPTAPRGPSARVGAVPISPAAASGEARALDAILEACRTQSSRALLPPRLPPPAAVPAAQAAAAQEHAAARQPAVAAAVPAAAATSGGRRPPPLHDVAAISCGPVVAGKAGPAVAPPTPSKLGVGLAVGGDAPDVFFL